MYKTMISNHFRFFWKAFVDNQHYKKKLLFQITGPINF